MCKTFNTDSFYFFIFFILWSREQSTSDLVGRCDKYTYLNSVEIRLESVLCSEDYTTATKATFSPQSHS